MSYTPLTDAEIEALAKDHEAFGFGLVDKKGFTTHGFDPQGMGAFARAVVDAAMLDRIAQVEPVAWVRIRNSFLEITWASLTAEHLLDGQPLYASPVSPTKAPTPCCEQFATCSESCTPRGRWLAQTDREMLAQALGMLEYYREQTRPIALADVLINEIRLHLEKP